MENHKPLLEQHLLTIFNSSPSPIYVCAGPDFKVIYANAATLKVWGKDASVIGKPFVEALPEIIDQPFPKLLKQVYESGVPYHTEQDSADLPVGDELQTYYFKFSYLPLTNDEGEIWGVMCSATDVTELVKAKREVEISQNNLRSMIMQAPVAICILKGQDFVVDIANEMVLEIWGTTANVIGKPIFEELPEVKGQGLEELLQEVYQSGKAFTANDRPVDLQRNGKKERVYLTFVYAPLRDSNGLINAVIAVASDVTEQVLAQQKKDDFLGIASHELKTPLTSLKASIQLMERLTSTEPNIKLEKLIFQSGSSVNKLVYLVEDLLNVSKLNEGQLNLNKENFTLSKMTNDCCQHVRLQGTHEIIIQGDLNLQVFADLHRIDQVVVNLVNNAVKYAPESREINIRIEKIDGFAKVSVIDYGPGIPENKLPHLFQRYYRVDSSGHQISGLGLGLYISNEIIEKHGGKMGVDSEVGVGSTFWFTLPL
ncbi:MAG: ATP-binding protein [Bacteroidota bacterium]